MKESLRTKISQTTLFLFSILLSYHVTAEQGQMTKTHFVRADNSESSVIEALAIQEMNDRGKVDILLVELPTKERFIFYRILNARMGELRFRLEHDSSPWWVEHTTIMHGKFETVREFLDYALRDSGMAKQVAYSFESESLICDSTFDYRPEKGQELSERFEMSVLENEKCMMPFRALPRVLADSIFYLDLFEAEVLYRYDELVDFLVRILHRVGFNSDLEVEPGEEIAFKRIIHERDLGTMVTPEELEFTSRFKSIDNADPLAGWHPEELFPEE